MQPGQPFAHGHVSDYHVLCIFPNQTTRHARCLRPLLQVFLAQLRSRESPTWRFCRQNPFDGEYTIFAGLSEVSPGCLPRPSSTPAGHRLHEQLSLYRRAHRVPQSSGRRVPLRRAALMAPCRFLTPPTNSSTT
eukprot:560864-Hanusia_phi.AAC.1